MKYIILENGVEINTIIADKDFCDIYCKDNGYTYELIQDNENTPDINKIKVSKESEITKMCYQSIIDGIDVETTKGVEHFSLEETDQINLTTALSAIQQGDTEYPYHSDGQLFRMFSADEIQSIANAYIQHKLYHTTLCNHLLIWIRRSESIEEIENISYNNENLPEDLAANMAYILSNN